MYALVDCNSFYASCEQIYRPDLRSRPVVVLSNNDGCIIALTKEAKALGLPNFSPYFKMRSLLKHNNVAVFSANFELYGDISQRVLTTLESEFGVDVEPYSIDEMFLDVTGIPDMRGFSFSIKETLWQHVKIPVCVGVGPSKTIAKLANKIAKQYPQARGVCVLDTEGKRRFWYQCMTINHVWGIGKRLTKQLNDMNIWTIEELLNADQKSLRKRFNVVLERTLCELKGEHCLSFEMVRPTRQEIFVTRSFGQTTASLNELLVHISSYASAAAEKLRAEKLKTKKITVFIMTSRFNEHYYHGQDNQLFSYYTNDTRSLISAARALVTQLFKPGFKYARCGIGLIDLADDKVRQWDFFTQGQSARSEKCMSVIDDINKRFGRDACKFSAERLTGKWSMNQHHLSKRFTTRWDELPLIK